jgi:demethylmenaquinone methyltransferase/2-methoxy-6-polyprenyl-1,4-benzoquinol methylase
MPSDAPPAADASPASARGAQDAPAGLGAARLLPSAEEEVPLVSGGEKARRVRSMFADIAPAYDFNNHFLSGGVDILWRRATVKMALKGLEGRRERVLDVCAGTGDLTFAFRKALGPKAEAIGCDFAVPMLEIAARKEGAPAGEVAGFSTADAQRLPFASDAFDVASVAFGIRNVADPIAALAEMARTIRPGGRVVVLEFTQPPGRLFRTVYYFYFFRVLPWLGGLFSRRRDAYAYLAQSVTEFDTCESLADKMRAAGLENVRFKRLTLGIAAIHVGEKL